MTPHWYKRLLLVPLLFLLPSVSYAQVEIRTDIQKQIEAIFAQIEILQQLLQETKGEPEPYSVPANRYKTTYYTGPVEAIYRVSSTELVPQGGSYVRAYDAELFDFVLDVYGGVLTDRYVSEFRVFSERDSDLGAFVERKTGTDDWILGINRYALDLSETSERDYLWALLVHELAHVLVVYERGMLSDYTNEFWTMSDLNHQDEIRNLQGDTLFEKTVEYYDENRGRFVSDYATLSPEEDLAEMFVAFVESQTFSYRILKNKRDFFEDYSLFVSAKRTIR